MSTIKQTCACGATLEVTGSGYDVSFRQRDFIKAHEGHDAQPNRMSGGSGTVAERRTDADPGYFVCPRCKGDGSGPPSGADGCGRCAGEGQVTSTTDLREYLRANLSDFSFPFLSISEEERLLDRIVENVGSWLAESGGTDAQEIESKKWTFRLDPSGPWRATRLWGSFYDPQGRRLSAAGDKTIEAMLNGLNRAES